MPSGQYERLIGRRVTVWLFGSHTVIIETSEKFTTISLKQCLPHIKTGPTLTRSHLGGLDMLHTLGPRRTIYVVLITLTFGLGSAISSGQSAASASAAATPSSTALKAPARGGSQIDPRPKVEYDIASPVATMFCFPNPIDSPLQSSDYGAVTCYQPYGDYVLAVDMMADGKSAGMLWSIRSNGYNRRGICRNNSGDQGQLYACNKNFRENKVVRFQSATCSPTPTRTCRKWRDWGNRSARRFAHPTRSGAND